MFVACDESGKNERFFVIGSAWISRDDIARLEARMTELRLAARCWGEVKWDKINESYLPFYIDFLSLAFTEIQTSFAFIIVDTSIVDKKTYHNGSDDMLQYKFMRQLIKWHATRLMPPEKMSELHIVFDNFQESKESREGKWQLKMQQFIETDLGSPIDHLQPCTSHICSLVQMIDIVTGALACKWNDKDGSLPQQKVIELIESLTEKKLNRRTEVTEKKFNIWAWRPSVRA